MKFLSLAFCLGSALGCAMAAEVMVVERIVAKVNGDIITSGELERERKQIEAQLRQRGLSGPELEGALKERSQHILRDRIDELLLVQRAKELNINVDSEVTKYLAELQVRSKIADPEKFQEYVREQTGLSYEDFKLEAKNGMLTQRVIGQEVQSRINIPRSEIEKYYNEHKDEFQREDRVFLREILISTQGKDEAGIAAAEKKAKELVARARKGERFADLAREHSDAVTASQGGELPPFNRGVLRKDLEDLLFSQEKGYVTDPIKQDSGFLILKVEETHKKGLATLEEVENEIRDKLFRPLYEPKVREYLTKLRVDAFLEIRDGYIDTGAAPGKDTSWTDPAKLTPETVTKEEVSAQTRRRRFLGILPIPGTKAPAKSSSR
ncbi:MAG: peptidylprolyl isomerase [Bryobacteraceae bacterium]|nr:peptidylprolyl isomerase [Bryobacteraceae bacterium]